MSFSKFCVSGYGLDDLAPLLPFLREHFTVADLQGGTFEFSLCGVDKGTGIEAALAHLEAAAADLTALGRIEKLELVAGAGEEITTRDVELGEPPVKQPRSKG